MKTFFRLFLLALLSVAQVAQADSPYIWNGSWAKNLTSKGNLLSNGQPVHYEGNRNYIGNSSGINGLTTGWVASGAVTVTSTTTNLPSASQIGYALAFAAGSAADYARYRFTVDQADYGKVFLLQFDQVAVSGYTAGDFKLDMYCTSDSTYASGLTRQALSTDNSSNVTAIPALTGTFKSSFSTSSGVPYCEERITRVANSSTLNLSNVFAGYGPVVQGAAVSGWQSYTPGWTTSGTAPAIGNGTLVGYWRRVGDSLQIQIGITSGTTTTYGTGNYYFGIPSGYTINSSVLSPTAGTADVDAALGSAVASNSAFYNGTVVYGNSTVVEVTPNGSTSIWSATVPFTPSASTANQVWTLNFTVPVNELAGSGTINVVQNDVEYASNYSTTGSNDSTSFAYGPSGSIVPTITLATSGFVNKTVSFPTPVQPTDEIIIEVSVNNNGVWTPVGLTSYYNTWTTQGTARYGISWDYTSNANQITVSFGSAGSIATNTSYAGTGGSWPQNSTDHWRVRKIKAGQAVGFGIVNPGTSAGLVSASGLPGNTTGNAAPTGYVGETVKSVSSTLTAASSVAWTAATNISLTTGTWLVQGTITARSVIGFNILLAYISTTSTTGVAAGVTSVTGCTFGYDQVSSAGQASSGYGQAVIYGKVLIVPSGSSPQTVYLGFASDATSANQFIGSMQAIRIY